MLWLARRSAWKVVKARLVTTRATTSALVKRRIFWVSPIEWRPRSVRLVAGGGVVLAELVLVLLPLVLRSVERDPAPDLALGGHRELERDLARPLVPGPQGVLARGHLLDDEGAVRRGPGVVGVVADEDHRGHLGVDVAVDPDEAGVLEGPGAALRALEVEVEAVLAREREDIERSNPGWGSPPCPPPGPRPPGG